MKRLAVAAVLLALLAAVSTAVAVAGGTRSRPALRLVKRSPLTLRAVSFRAGERIRFVVTYADGKATRRVAATAAGAATARFAQVHLGPCDSFSARATGNLRSWATLQFTAPACAPE